MHLSIGDRPGIDAVLVPVQKVVALALGRLGRRRGGALRHRPEEQIDDVLAAPVDERGDWSAGTPSSGKRSAARSFTGNAKSIRSSNHGLTAWRLLDSTSSR